MRNKARRVVFAIGDKMGLLYNKRIRKESGPVMREIDILRARIAIWEFVSFMLYSILMRMIDRNVPLEKFIPKMWLDSGIEFNQINRRLEELNQFTHIANPLKSICDRVGIPLEIVTTVISHRDITKAERQCR